MACGGLVEARKAIGCRAGRRVGERLVDWLSRDRVVACAFVVTVPSWLRLVAEPGFRR